MAEWSKCPRPKAKCSPISRSAKLKLRIIQEVRRRPPLWDENDTCWGQKQLACKLWNDIGQIVGCPGSVVKNKWNNLRYRHYCEVSKEIEAVKTNCPYKSKWPFYNCMKFIDYIYTDSQCLEYHGYQSQKLYKSEGIVDVCDVYQNNSQCNQNGPSSSKNTMVACNNRDEAEEEFDPNSIKIYVQKGNIEQCCQPNFEELDSDLVSTLRKEQMKNEDNAKRRAIFEELGSSSERVIVDPCSPEKLVGDCPSPENVVVEDLRLSDNTLVELSAPAVVVSPRVSDKIDSNLLTSSVPVKKDKVEVAPPEKIPVVDPGPPIPKETKDPPVPKKVISQQIIKCLPEPPVKETPKKEENVNCECTPCSGFMNSGESNCKNSPNYQFLMSLLPYLDLLGQVECLDTRAQIQCVVNEAIRRRQNPCSYYPGYF